MLTLIQLEYIVAIDTWRHFATAADKCFVTQPTLSMQVKKLEEQLGIIIFDRSKQPVVPTEAGKAIIQQARIVLNESRKINEIVKQVQGMVAGELRLGIIPTLAPYLLPRFTGSFIRNYPDVNLLVKEMLTEDIQIALKKDKIDAGILVTPLHDAALEETPLFYEKFVLYAGKNEPVLKNKIASSEDLDQMRFWLLASGHCFRTQTLNLCQNRNSDNDSAFQFESGSLETLIKLVDAEDGSTLLPELATLDMENEKRNQLVEFGNTPSYREVSLVFSRNFAKEKLLKVLAKEIKDSVPEEMLSSKGKVIVEYV